MKQEGRQDQIVVLFMFMMIWDKAESTMLFFCQDWKFRTKFRKVDKRQLEDEKPIQIWSNNWAKERDSILKDRSRQRGVQ